MGNILSTFLFFTVIRNFDFFNDSISNYYREVDRTRKYQVYKKYTVVTIACRLGPFQEDETKSRDSDFYP